VFEMIGEIRAGRRAHAKPVYLDAMKGVIERAEEDPALAAQMLVPPSENELALAATPIDPAAIHTARQTLIAEIAHVHGMAVKKLYARHGSRGAFSPDAISAGRRSLRNAALRILTSADDEAAAQLAHAHYSAAANMTDMMAGLASLTRIGGKRCDAALDDFYKRFHGDPLVLDKWMGVQAMSPRADVVERVRALMRHPAFSIKNPNRVRALIGAFSSHNPLRFHDPSGPGYALLREVVQTLDPINPQTAARMMTPFETWRRYDPRRQEMIQAELRTIAAGKPISPNLYEVVTKILEPAGV